MAVYPKIKINHSPVTTYPGTAQGSWVGAQSVVGQRGSLPTFNDSNSYFVSKLTGSSANAGTAAAPKASKDDLFATTQSFNDTSGNGRHMTQTGTVPYISYPCRPVPAQGNFAAGPFSAANYLNLPAALAAALSTNDVTFYEGYIFFESFNAVNKLFSCTSGTTVECSVANDGSLSFLINATTLTSATGLIELGKQYYVAFTFTSAAVDGKNIWLGDTPELTVQVATATQTQNITGLSGIRIGRGVGVGFHCPAYFDRLVFSSVARSTFPTPPTASNIEGFFEMETRPLMQTAPKSYIVVSDNEEYNEGWYANFQYDITAGFGIYAADGKTPVFKLQKGVFPGTYGAGNREYVPLTASPSTTCYVAKTGNDGTGARGNPALPFLTIQAAINATTTSGDTAEVTDNGTYTEDLTLPARNLTLQASAGALPIVRNIGTTQIATTNSNSLAVAGIFFLATHINGKFLDNNSGALLTATVYACSFSHLGGEQDTMFEGSVQFTVTDSVFKGAVGGNNGIANGATSTATSTIRNCLFEGAWNFGALHNSIPVVVKNCSFIGELTVSNTGVLQLIQCKFKDCGVTGTGSTSIAVTQCVFENALASGVTVGSANVLLVSSCLFTCQGAPHGIGGDVTTQKVWIYNCSIIGAVRGVYLQGTQVNSRVYNVTTLGCTTAGVDATVDVVALGLADSGSGVAYQSGVVPTFSASDLDYISEVSGTENLTLLANSTGAFLVEDDVQPRDPGAQSALFEVSMASIVLNGLTFEGDINEEGGVSCVKPNAIDVSYCTFQGLGTYGVLVPGSGTISKCLFNVNGHAVKLGQYANTVSYCAAYGCAGAFIQNYGRSVTLSHNSSYACAYGQYDSDTSSFVASDGNIYARSGVYDYSGEGELTYSCVGTLDPAHANILDSHSLREDPLFADPDGGDLTLQSLARDFFHDSPCIKVDSASKDMGAFLWTYGVAATTWTLIDFATGNGTDDEYRNPDGVPRSFDAIKLAEGDREDGALYSGYATIKKGYTLTWNPAANPMPFAQLVDLINMYIGDDNRIQIDFGLGAGFEDAFFGRGQGFEYDDLGGLYQDDTVPEPLKSLTIRMV